MDLILHIGCEKTGTTSLQSWFDQHADTLEKHGVFYSAVLGRPNNRRISYYGLEPGTPDDGLRIEGIATPEQHAALNQRIADDLVEEVERAAAAGCKTFVISNEHCHSRLKTEAAVAKVHSLLRPLFARMEVHCMLRPQMDMCLSLASTLSRNGGAIGRAWIDAEMQPSAAYYALDRLLERWAAVFGREAIRPVSFRRHPDSIVYFEKLLGIADLALPRKPSANAALDFRVMAIVNAMQASDPNNRSTEYGTRFFINELPVEQRLTLDRYSAQQFQGRFLKTNTALCRAWPGIDLTDLRPDWPSYPEEGNIDRLDMAKELGPFMRRIIDRLRAESAFERARFMGANSDRELARNNLEAAQKACREGLTLARQAGQCEAYRRQMELLTEVLENRLKRIDAMRDRG